MLFSLQSLNYDLNFCFGLGLALALFVLHFASSHFSKNGSFYFFDSICVPLQYDFSPTFIKRRKLCPSSLDLDCAGDVNKGTLGEAQKEIPPPPRAVGRSDGEPAASSITGDPSWIGHGPHVFFPNTQS